MGVYTRACVSVSYIQLTFLSVCIFSLMFTKWVASALEREMCYFFILCIYFHPWCFHVCLCQSLILPIQPIPIFFPNFYRCNTFRYYFCFYFAVMFGFLPRDWSAGCFLWMYVNSSFVLNYINVYHEDACDGNLYLVFFLWLFSYAWVMSFDWRIKRFTWYIK